MRKCSALLTGAAIVAGVGMATCPPCQGANPALERFHTMTAGALPTSANPVRDSAIALRAAWLARGHSVQQLAGLAPPAITGGKVDASTITVGQAGAFPSLTVSYTTDTPGLNFISVEFEAPNGQTVYGGGYSTPYYTQSGTLGFAIVTPISLYAMPGVWRLASATVVDNAGNSTTYTAQQLKPLFDGRGFTVINTGPVARHAPEIIGGQLLNTTVSLSSALPQLKAIISAKDGNGPGIYQAYVNVSPPGGAYSFYSFLPNPQPIRAGDIKANNVFGSYSPTGTWTIVGFGVCDYANNCSGSSTDSDIVALFGTDTFTVTQ